VIPRARIQARMYGLAIALVAMMRPLGATTVIPPTFEELVDTAREIFVGEVVSRQSQWVDAGGGRTIVTLVTFAISDSLKGGLLTQTTLEFLGGTVGETTLEVSGMPAFNVGDRDVLFVGRRNAVSPVVGFAHGRFRIARETSSGTDSVRRYDGRPLPTTAAISRPAGAALAGTRSLTLASFRDQIVTRLRTTGGRR
jgi:hypothetical protein